jgi:pimeloyl-ACP methyl ester carboxylesterase
MSYVELNAIHMHYEERGEGRPVVFLPGWTASSRFFRDQLDRFGRAHRAIALDYRSHGRSTQTLAGHSIASYARDVQAFLTAFDLQHVVLVGHSMGVFVAWEYIQQFDSDRLAGFVNVDQPPCDGRRADWPYGDELLDVCRFAVSIQENHVDAMRQMLDLVFAHPRSTSDAKWMLAEMLRVPAPVAGMMLLDDMSYDARPLLPHVTVPTLLCYGRYSALTPLETGRFTAQALPNARLVVFEQSGHCPFIEEPERFHEEVCRFIADLGAARPDS